MLRKAAAYRLIWRSVRRSVTTRLRKQSPFALIAAGSFGVGALEGSVRLGEERSANSLLSTARRECEGREVAERHAGCV
jgi:hypothetical protein